MLSILKCLVATIVIGGAVFALVNLFTKRVVIRNLYRYTVSYGYNYLTDKDEKYYEERALGACVREVILRFVVVFLIHCILMILAAVFVPKEWSFAVFPEWSIKAGLICGIMVSFGVQMVSIFSICMQVGRLKKIDDNGIGWFDDALGGEFSVDIGGCWPPCEERPIVGDCYVLVDEYPKYLFIRPIECERAWRKKYRN